MSKHSRSMEGEIKSEEMNKCLVSLKEMNKCIKNIKNVEGEQGRDK